MLFDTNELLAALKSVCATTPVKLVLSNPVDEKAYRRVNISLIKNAYRVEKLTLTQAFHELIAPNVLEDFLCIQMQNNFRQLHAWTHEGKELAVKISKNGKILTNAAKSKATVKIQDSHNREKTYLIPEGANVPALYDMGVFTTEGNVAAGMAHKFRQINRFIEFVDDLYKNECPDPIKILDFGCGKSYLTFLVHHYFTHIKRVRTDITGLDLKRDVVDLCNKSAEKYGCDGLVFKQGDIGEYSSFTADLLISLHACDTATDDAIHAGIKNNVGAMLVAPCCQHELMGQMNPQSLALTARYGVVKERIAAALTDAVRANVLLSQGYKTQVMEFVDLAHTPKNLLIRAVRADVPEKTRRAALDEVRAVVDEFGFEPAIVRLVL